MEAGRADSRFLLPGTVDATFVTAPVSEWREQLREMGLRVADAPGEEPPSLAVCTGETLEAAVASGAPSLIVEGPVRARALAEAGYAVRRYAALPTAARPHAFVPLGRRAPNRYALTTWMVPDRRWKRYRNRALASAMGVASISLPGRSITVASREDPVPELIAGALYAGLLPRDPDWILSPAQGDRLSRGVFLVFPPREGVPSHVVKFARVPGLSEPFELDEAALRLLDGAGEVVTRHVPTVLARFAVNGLEASVETAATGQRMIAFLHTPAAKRDKRRTIDGIAAWLLDLARATRDAPPSLAAERARLARELLTVARRLPDAAAVVRRLEGVPAVLQHNDLGTWNIAVDGGRFTVLDWESARRHGLPLWDLWYFLMDAEAHLAKAATIDEREEHFARLFGGRLPASEFLFRWTRRYAQEHGIGHDAIAAMATFCWLHHGRSGLVRQAELRRFDDDADPGFWLRLLERIWQRWLTDPALGLHWPALARP